MADVQELTCRELVELVTDYLEGALSETDRGRFDEHLGGCDACGAYLEQMRQTIRMLGALPEDAIPPEGMNELLVRFRGWR